MKGLVYTAASCAVLLGMAGFALSLFHVDSVTGASAIYTNAARTGWFYPTDTSYTSEFAVGVQKTIPIVYGGEGQAEVVVWSDTPALGGAFIPSISSISSYRWTPGSVGSFASLFKIQKTGASDNYNQMLYFRVIPEPGTLLVAGAALLAVRLRRVRTR